MQDALLLLLLIAALADVVLSAPLNGIVELAGPERFRLDKLARRLLSAKRDRRRVEADAGARYFGARLEEHSLTAGSGARIAPTRFEDWLSGAGHVDPSRRPRVTCAPDLSS